MAIDILTKVQEKLASSKLEVNTLFFGQAEWVEFEDFAAKHWTVFIKKHQNNYLAATRILYCDLPKGIYTSAELAQALAYARETEGE